MATDLELLDAWRRGDRDAGALLLKRHFTGVYSFFRYKIPEHAEDLTQQTFLRCVEARDRIEDDRNFKGYLFVTARNVLFQQIRRKARRPVDPDFDVESLEDLLPSASAHIGKHQDDRLLVRALHRLPLELQVALELYYVQQLRGEALTQALEIPSGTVRSRIRRGLERLREAMNELSASPQAIRTTLTDLHRWAARVREAAAQNHEGQV